MAGGCHRCLTCFFTCSSVLLLWVCLHDVEASSCQHVIHKKVGDTVELSSCLPTEGVTEARWKYGGVTIADKNKDVSEKQFMGRFYLNPTNFSLTVRGLTLQDSGNFSFVSEAGGNQQRDTVIISLQVHEPITKQPVLTSNSTWHTLNESCTVLLECSGTTDSSVSYNWTVRNQTRRGFRLQYIIRPQDGDTKFTCTAYNAVSEMSAFDIVKCSNETQGKEEYVLLMGVPIGGCLIVVIALGIAVGVCYYKQGRQAGSDSHDLTVYADISEVTIEGETAATMKPCSVYETIDNRVNSRTPGPETVYDKIQFSRMRKASVSPYQEIS